MASYAKELANSTSPGLHIYMGGVGFQQLFVLVFFYFAILFHRMLLRSTTLETSRAFTLLYIVYAVLVLITVCELA